MLLRLGLFHTRLIGPDLRRPFLDVLLRPGAMTRELFIELELVLRVLELRERLRHFLDRDLDVRLENRDVLFSPR